MSGRDFTVYIQYRLIERADSNYWLNYDVIPLLFFLRESKLHY